ncbi:MAG: hypothetical protein EZS28_012120 [Streblomastix strix]|uniref:CCR4-Not complex component Not N-terminal domain-containing protein n=1 Tax=Streblomastix strix TaxID=222440 RepID=A0A5J4WBS5_9EUKA|nr:MAG: hypothetical protein EZS28_012120 [Streblomastix strix]
MAQTKKLLGEIDQTCKKVQEHLKEFRSLFEKVYTLQGTLREKAELDLRWQIIKLKGMSGLTGRDSQSAPRR